MNHKLKAIFLPKNRVIKLSHHVINDKLLVSVSPRAGHFTFLALGELLQKNGVKCERIKFNEDPKKIASLKNVKKVKFVRNPFHRAVSSYTFFCGNPVFKSWEKFGLNLEQRNDLTFRQFIQLLKTKNIQNIDHHLANQVENGEESLFNYDKIEKIEDYLEVIPKLLKEAGVNIDLTSLEPKHIIKKTDSKEPAIDIPFKDFLNKDENKGKKGLQQPPYECFYDEELKKEVAEIYKTDLYDYDIEPIVKKVDGWQNKKLKKDKILNLIKNKIFSFKSELNIFLHKKEPLYIFVHIPKNGGTTFRESFGKNFKNDEKIYWYHDLRVGPTNKDITSLKDLGSNLNIDKFHRYLRSLSQESKDKIKFISGHNKFDSSIVRHFKNRDLRYIFFLRDPIDRIVSLFNHYKFIELKRNTENTNMNTLNEDEFFKWYERVKENPLMSLSQLKHLQEFFKIEKGDILTLNRMLKKIIFIGQVENLNKDIEVISKKTGYDIKVLELNKSEKKFENFSKKPFKPENKEKFLKKLENDFKEDIEFYDNFKNSQIGKVFKKVYQNLSDRKNKNKASNINFKPLMTSESIEFMDNFLKSSNNSNVLEFGSGYSTIWLSERTKNLVSIEHNKEWYDKIQNILKSKKKKVDYRFLNRPYSNVCDKFRDEYFDLIIVDGRDRVECFEKSLSKVKKGGYILLDDAQREKYLKAKELVKNWDCQKTFSPQRDTYIWKKPIKETKKNIEDKSILVAIAKNESPYLLEWIVYHKFIIGFDEIIIYDNDSTDKTEYLLKRLQEKGMCKYIKWPRVNGKKPQQSAYDHAVYANKLDFEWMMFLDIDEFLVLKKFENIKEVIYNFRDKADCICFNWLCFGNADKKEYNSELVIKRFTNSNENNSSVNNHMKSIIKIESIKDINVHIPFLKNNAKYFHICGNELMFKENPQVEHITLKKFINQEVAQINHYQKKSVEENKFRTIQGRATVLENHPNVNMKPRKINVMLNEFNIKNKDILKHVKKLEEIMEPIKKELNYSELEKEFREFIKKEARRYDEIITKETKNPRETPKFIIYKNKILGEIKIDSELGLEIGPFDKPFIKKNEGKIEYADYRTTEELKEFAQQAKGHNSEFVVDIDYVLKDNTLNEIKKKYDYVILSHVIEHVPNMITFLNILSEKLNENGKIFLIVPNKNYTFDILKPETSLGEILQNYYYNKKKASFKDVFNKSYYQLPINAQKLWNKEINKNELKPLKKDFLKIVENAKNAETQYIDTHQNIFTDKSFKNIIFVLIENKILDFSSYEFYPTQKGFHDFMCVLYKKDTNTKPNELLQHKTMENPKSQDIKHIPLIQNKISTHLTRYYMYNSIYQVLLKQKDLSGSILGISGLGAISNMFPKENKRTNISHPQYDVTHLKQIKDDSYDIVICDQVLEHVTEPFKAVSEMRRVLKKGGLLILTTCLTNPIHNEPIDFWRFTPEALRYLCKDFSHIIDATGWGNAEAMRLILAGKRGEKVIPGTELEKVALKNDMRNLIVTWIMARK